MKNKLPDDFHAVRRPPAGYRAKKLGTAGKPGPHGQNTQSDERGRAHQNSEGHQGGQHGGSQRGLEK